MPIDNKNNYMAVDLAGVEKIVKRAPEYFQGLEVAKPIPGGILIYSGRFKDLSLRAGDFATDNRYDLLLLGTATLTRETRFNRDIVMPTAAFQSLSKRTEISTPENQLLAIGINPNRHYRVGLAAAAYNQGVKFDEQFLNEVFESLDAQVTQWMFHHQ